MPYKDNKDLPSQIKENLPQRAQAIFRESYNNAWEQYKDPSKRRGNSSREEVANKVAWSSVKRKYKKQQDKWTKK